MAVDKNKALETALTQIEKQFGKGAVMRLGENKHMNIEHISTGSLSLDIALGIGGLPRGRIVEIYGPESSGKTTLSLHCIAEGQKNGGNVAFIDVEHALDPTYAAALGVDHAIDGGRRLGDVGLARAGRLGGPDLIGDGGHAFGRCAGRAEHGAHEGDHVHDHQLAYQVRVTRG